MLRNISFELPEGCIMGLIGENGAGKSTLIKLMLDIIARDGGSVTLLGRKTEEEKLLAKDDIGVVIDTPAFSDSMTGAQLNSIMKNVYSRWNEETYFGFLERFGIEKNKQFKRLSMGMKMKLSLAVALSHNAKLLILDEPTNGLDPVIRKEIVELLNEFTRDGGNSVLISSHIVSDLERICDYVAFMKGGQLMLCEEKDRLLEKYCSVCCTAEELDAMPEEAVKSRRDTRYSVEAIVERSAVPEGMQMDPIGIEELFVMYINEEKKEV
jgi:ABC-2 type transport system ATP-binding protein